MRWLFNEFAKHYHFYLIILVLIGLMSLTLHAGMKGADGREYLRWTHSFVFDQDLHLLNDFAALGGSYRLTPTGYIFERVNIGTALLWTPFYGAAMLMVPMLAGQTSASYPADGTIPLLWVNFSSWLYPILSGILTFAPYVDGFPLYTLAGSIITILLGTPVLFYMVTFPLSSHPASIFLASLLLYLWLSYEPRAIHLALFNLGPCLRLADDRGQLTILSFFYCPASICSKISSIRKTGDNCCKTAWRLAWVGYWVFCPR